jgi:hypothetical protein
MADLLRSPWTVLVLLALFAAPLAAGFLLEIDWLIRIGFFWLFMFLLALYGVTYYRWQRQREVRENMRRILEKRMAAGDRNGEELQGKKNSRSGMAQARPPRRGLRPL